MARQAVQRGLLITLGTLLGLAAIVVGAVFVLSNTDWGRERVRRQLVSILGGVAEGGQVRIGRLDGNLLTGATATDISITDSAGAPLLTADSAQLRYDIRGFLRKELHFNDVRLVNALVVLDKPPGGEWNFARIFPSDTTATPRDTTAGWGDRIQLEDVTLVNTRVIARTPWAPDDSLTGAAREAAIAGALGPETRQNIVAVPGGWQTVYDFRQINGRLPLLQLAEPDSSARIIEVASLRMEAYPFKPPAAEVRDVRGRFLVTGDSLWWQGVTLRLPGSQIAGPGKVAFDSGATALQLRGAPIATGDLRWLYPRLPAGGTGTLDFTLRMAGDTSLYAARGADVRLEGASVQGDFGLLDVNDTLVFQDTDLRFAGVDTRLIERLVPDAELPRSGTLAGRAAVAGPLTDLRLDADVTFHDRVAGRNRVLAEGGVGVDGERVRMEDLRVDLRPIQVALLREAVSDLPLDGTVTGNATMNGVVQDAMRARFDLTHRGSSGTSHVTGNGAFRQDPTWVNVDAQLQPLSLVTVGRFAPAIGLRGTARGPLRLEGALAALRVDSRLTLSDGGILAARGVLDLDGPTPGYDMRVATQLFNANAVVATAPRTSVTATAYARGRGVDPETMTATLRADLQTSSFDTVAVDSAKVRVALANGLARVDTLRVHGPSTVAEATGTLGLRADRNGELTYRVAVDSLHAFAQFLGIPDTTTTPPRPAVRAAALARARLDSAARDAATLVQRAAVGGRPPTLEVDEVPEIPNDSVGGSLYAAGTARGNIRDLTVNGRAAVLDLVARGNTVNRGRVEYAWLNGFTPQASLVAATHLDSVRAAGFALDSVDARVAYQGERGVADVTIAQDTGTDYSARATFRLALDENELLFEQLAMRFDTTRWVAQRPGRILWGQRGVLVDSLELSGGDQRRIFVNGLIPTAGEADLELSVLGFQIAHLTQLLQSDVPLTGEVSLEARVTGPSTAPRMAGALGVTYARYDDADLPDVRSTFTYGDRALALNGAVTSRLGRGQLATFTGTVPVDLAFQDAGPRLPDQPMELSLDADSLPLDILGELTDVISNVDGTVTGALRVRGTTRAPVYAGALSLTGGHMRIVPAGVDFGRMSGLLRLQGDSVVIDSLVGFNTGRVLVRGGLDITRPAQPGFDLYLVANDATVLDNDLGRVRADAGLAMRGPFEAAYISGAATVTQGVLYFEEPDGKDVVGTDDPALFAVVDSNVTSELALLPEPSPLLENLRVDVALGINRNTWVRSENANVEIFTPDDPGPLEVSVDQGQDRITLRGQVTTELGEYRYLGKRFEIDRGSVLFTGGQRIDPLVQVTGRYEVRLPAQKALTIRILVGGTLNSPQLSLESDAQPPLPQSDLLSYLAFGRTSSSLLQLDGSGVTGGGGGAGGIGALGGAVGAAASQRFAALAVSALVESAESGLSQGLGADVLTITPADATLESLNPFGGGFASFLRGTEVEAGRYVNPRTFVSVIARPSIFSANPENRFIPGVRVQHRFTPTIRLEASYEGRYIVEAPTLEQQTRLSSTGVFGVFLIREWGW